MHLSAGKYKVTSQLTIDYAGQAGNGFRLLSQGATLDGQAIGSGPVLQILCGGGTTASPTGCFYFKQEGTLFVQANTAAYAVVIGKADFSDAQNSMTTRPPLNVNNANTSNNSGACQFDYVLDSDLYAVCVLSPAERPGWPSSRPSFQRISGAGTAAGTGGRSVVLENGFNFSNTFFGLDLEVSTDLPVDHVQS